MSESVKCSIEMYSDFIIPPWVLAKMIFHRWENSLLRIKFRSHAINTWFFSHHSFLIKFSYFCQTVTALEMLILLIVIISLKISLQISSQIIPTSQISLLFRKIISFKLIPKPVSATIDPHFSSIKNVNHSPSWIWTIINNLFYYVTQVISGRQVEKPEIEWNSRISLVSRKFTRITFSKTFLMNEAMKNTCKNFKLIFQITFYFFNRWLYIFFIKISISNKIVIWFIAYISSIFFI